MPQNSSLFLRISRARRVKAQKALPEGSKCSNSRVSGAKNRSEYGLRELKPTYLALPFEYLDPLG